MGPCPSVKLGLILEVLAFIGETGDVRQALQGKGGSEGRDRRHTIAGAGRGGSYHQLSWALGTFCLPLTLRGRQECWC